MDFHSSGYPFRTVLFNGDKGRGIFEGKVRKGIRRIYKASAMEIYSKGILATKYDTL
jgi:hypothetical protein